MKPATTLAVAAAMMLAAGAAYAQSGESVLKTKGCLNCHSLDQKKVGPPYKEVAAKYRDDKGAEARLVQKISEGKTHPKIGATEAEIKAAVEYVLSLK